MMELPTAAPTHAAIAKANRKTAQCTNYLNMRMKKKNLRQLQQQVLRVYDSKILSALVGTKAKQDLQWHKALKCLCSSCNTVISHFQFAELTEHYIVGFLSLTLPHLK